MDTMKTRELPLWRRAVATFVALIVAAGPLGTPAFAAATLLADEPVASSRRAEPNVVMTVDDSTSMHADFLPDYIIGAGAERRRRARLLPRRQRRDESRVRLHRLADVASPHLSPDELSRSRPTPRASTARARSPTGRRAWPAPVHSNALNRAYYDPSQTYRPPLDSLGVSLPNMTTYTMESRPIRGPRRSRTSTCSERQRRPVLQLRLAGRHELGSGAAAVGQPLPHQRRRLHAGVPGLEGNAEYQYPWKNARRSPTTPSITGAQLHQDAVLRSGQPEMAAVLHDIQQLRLQYGNVHPSRQQVLSADLQLRVRRRRATRWLTRTTRPAGCQKSPLHASPGSCTKGAECLLCSCTSPSKVTGASGSCKADEGRRSEQRRGMQLRRRGMHAYMRKPCRCRDGRERARMPRLRS